MEIARILTTLIIKTCWQLTPTENKRPVDGDACIKWWSDFCRKNEVTNWLVTDPKINVFGDNAIVIYYAHLNIIFYFVSYKFGRSMSFFQY